MNPEFVPDIVKLTAGFLCSLVYVKVPVLQSKFSNIGAVKTCNDFPDMTSTIIKNYQSTAFVSSIPLPNKAEITPLNFTNILPSLG